MVNENVEPLRNPSRDNKTIKSGYKKYEDEEDKKDDESERSFRRGSEIHSGELIHQEDDLDRGGVGGTESGKSNRAQKRQKQAGTGKKNTDSNLSAHQEDARRQ